MDTLYVLLEKILIFIVQKLLAIVKDKIIKGHFFININVIYVTSNKKELKKNIRK